MQFVGEGFDLGEAVFGDDFEDAALADAAGADLRGRSPSRSCGVRTLARSIEWTP